MFVELTGESQREAWLIFLHLCRYWRENLGFSQENVLKPWNDFSCLMGVGRLASRKWVVPGTWFSGMGGLGSISLPSPATGWQTKGGRASLRFWTLASASGLSHWALSQQPVEAWESPEESVRWTDYLFCYACCCYRHAWKLMVSF